MEENTPYQPPSSSQIRELQSHTQLITEELRKTKPWVIFLAVVGFILAALSLFGGLAMFVLGAIGMSGSGSENIGFRIGFGLGIGSIYLIAAFFYFYPSFRLLKFGTCIGRFQRTGNGADLLEAITQQRRFWRFVSIALIVLMIFYIMFVIAILGFGAFSGIQGV